MTRRNPGSVWTPLYVIFAVFVLGGVSLVVMRMESLTNRSESFALDVSQHTEFAESLLGYRELDPIRLPIPGAHGIAIDANGTIVVCGSESVGVFDANGMLLRTITPAEKPRCVAIGMDRVYVGGSGSIEVFSLAGESIAVWALKTSPLTSPLRTNTPVPVSISVNHQHVYLADAGNQRVLQFDHEGNETARIANGFVVPSGHFDVVAQENGLVYIVNPGARRVETYTENGRREAVWGRAGSSLVDFFGCCNPAHLALLPNGDFVTSEKGIPRIKVYDSSGNFKCVVAGTRQLSSPPNQDRAAIDAVPVGGQGVISQDVFDIAVTPDGKILALDPTANCIRVFETTNEITPLPTSTNEAAP